MESDMLNPKYVKLNQIPRQICIEVRVWCFGALLKVGNSRKLAKIDGNFSAKFIQLQKDNLIVDSDRSEIF